MSIPTFTAEASLDRRMGRFPTSRNRTNVRTPIIGSIAPALGISDEGIEIHSCRPGYIQLGEGPNMVCIDPGDPFGTRGHEGPGEVGPGPGEPTSRGGKPKLKNGCTDKQILSDAAKFCGEKADEDYRNGLANPHYLNCVGANIRCCQDDVGKDGKKKCGPFIKPKT